jgi:hypothetical protein
VLTQGQFPDLSGAKALPALSKGSPHMQMNKLTHPLVKTPQPARTAHAAQPPRVASPARPPQAAPAKAAQPAPSGAQSALDSLKLSTKLAQFGANAANTKLRTPK